MPLTLGTCSRWNGPSQQRKPRLGHTSESVGERISFSPPLIALSNSLASACAHCPLSLSPLCIYWFLCTIQKRALFVLVLAGGQKQRDGYGWEWPDSASVPGLCPNTETLLSCPSVFREELSIFLLCCYAVGCWLTYLPGLSKKFVYFRGFWVATVACYYSNRYHIFRHIQLYLPVHLFDLNPRPPIPVDWDVWRDWNFNVLGHSFVSRKEEILG